MTKQIRSILRYPGGKTRAIKIIRPLIPHGFSEFREPFVGGGSIFIDAKQSLNPNSKYVINDLNYDLYCFWKHLQQSNSSLYKAIKAVKESETDGKSLFFRLANNIDIGEFERAVRFFVLNRISFSGTVDSGGFSKQAFINRFTFSSIEKILEIEPLLHGVEIYNEDYEKFLFDDKKDVFIFLDPPYNSQSKSRLYGKKGDLHLSFDHKRFAENMKLCKHKWLITLDDCEENRRLFNFANIYNWELQYGMNNYKSNVAAKGKELFISNYDLSDKIKHPTYLSIGWNESIQLSLFDKG